MISDKEARAVVPLIGTLLFAFATIELAALPARQGDQPSAVSTTTVPPREKLRIAQAIEIALANNPVLRVARERAASIQARVDAAKSKYYPQVSFNGIAKLGLSGATNGLGLVGLPASPLWRTLSDAVTMNHDVYDFGRTRHSVAIAEAESEAARYDSEAVRIDVARRAEETFLKVLRAQQVIKVREQALRERQEITRRSEEFFHAGLTSKLETQLARADLGMAELALTHARSDEQVAWTEFFASLGRPEGSLYDLIEPEPKLSPPGELAAETDQALKTRPDLKSLQAESDAQEERLRYARSLRRPTLRGTWSAGYARLPQLTLSRLMVGGLGLFAPLYTGGELESEVRQDERNLEALRAQYAARVFEVRVEVRRAHTEGLNALESARANQNISSYAREALRLARTRYEAQLTSFVELLTAETTSEKAQGDYAQALYDYQIARAHLDAAMGLLP